MGTGGDPSVDRHPQAYADGFSQQSGRGQVLVARPLAVNQDDVGDVLGLEPRAAVGEGVALGRCNSPER